MATDKPHWTQTPEGKKKLSRSIRKAYKRKRENANGESLSLKENGRHQEIDSDALAYALGRVEGFIEYFAKSANISERTLTTELGKILSGKKRG